MRPARDRRFLAPLLDAAAPIDLRILGRTLLHAAFVGLGAGVIGAVFFVCLEVVQRLLLEDICGYIPLRAHGEALFPLRAVHHYRWYLLMLMPAVGALGSGLVSMLAPETRGGGGDAMIDAFHRGGGVIRRRVIWWKGVASVLTLGAGGAGGREGPTMQIGGGLGSTVGRWLGVSERERRILLVAGVAAGIAAVFRTPLGAALLAAEVLYRDDFESDALIPGVLGQRHRLLGGHLALRRIDAVRARAALSVRAGASAALRCPRGRHLDHRRRFLDAVALGAARDQEAAGAGVGATGSRRPLPRYRLRADALHLPALHW